MFLNCSKCFERHTVHHQELCLCSQFPLRLDYGRSPYAYVNQRPQIQLELLMMSGVSLETCWAFNERWNNKFYYKVTSCWLFILSHTTMHGSMNIKHLCIMCNSKNVWKYLLDSNFVLEFLFLNLSSFLLYIHKKKHFAEETSLQTGQIKRCQNNAWS
jgi:hypothetical protein